MSIGLTNSNLLSATTESFQEELIFDQTIEGFMSPYVAAGPSIYIYQGQFEEILFKLEKNTEYKVVFDGIEYILPSDKFPPIGGGLAPVDYYLGDENLLLFSTQGLSAPNVFPFAILPCDVRSMGAPIDFMLMIATTLEGESHSIQIYKTGRKNTGKLVFEVNDFTDFDPESGGFNAYGIFALIPNYEYKIVINGEEFNCQTYAEMNAGSGNWVVIMHDLLERFYMAFYPDGEIFISLGIKSDSYDIQIYKMHEKETLIDLSLEISGQAADANVVGMLFDDVFNAINNMPSLPSVTTSDVGKILQVNSNGQWAAVLISSAENSGF